MKKKGFRFSFRAAVCVAVLSHSALAAASPAAADSQPASSAGQADAGTAPDAAQAAQADRTAKRTAADAKKQQSWLTQVTTNDASFFNLPAVAGSSLFGVAPKIGPIFSATTASGSLVATATTYNYSAAPWVITSGTGTYPDGGGTATFNPLTSPTPGTILTASSITVDVSPDLSQINYNSVFNYNLVAGTSTSIVADPTNGLTLNAANTVSNSPTGFFTGVNTISSPISGGGTTGVIKTGVGIVSLTGSNIYTGGTHLNGGELIIASTAAVGDAVFGAAGTGNGISFNGGTLFSNVTGGLTSARNIFLDTNGGTIQTATATTLGGVISGTGSLSVNGYGAVQLTLTGTNTYTGATINSLSTSGYITLSGNGSVATSASYDLASFVTLDNSGTTGVNRLNDTGAIAARGMYLNLLGNSATATAETVGAVTLADGVSTISVTPGTAGTSLTAASFTRQNGGALLVRGTNLGAAPGAGNGNIYATTAPALIGGGGATTTSQSIVPWAIGNLTLPATITTGNSAANLLSSSLVTYTAANGFRPLDTTEYATTLGTNATDNVRLTAATVTAGTNVTANALLLAPSATQTVSGGTINITSGALLYSPTASAAGTISAALNFGTAEGIISNTSGLTVSGAISGSGGLTLFSPTASTTTVSGANTYTGTTTILAGQTAISANVPNDGVTAGPFGLDTSAIVMNAGTGYAFVNGTAALTFSRNVIVAGPNAPGLDYFGNTSGAGTFTMNGNIDLEHNLVVVGGNSNTQTTFNGVISGPGGLVGYTTGGYYDTINGNNTFTGGVNARGDVFTLGSDTAFGNGGTVYVSAASTFLGSGTAARTIANPWVLLATPTFSGTAPLTLSGAFNLNGSSSVAVSNTALTTLSGVVSNGALTKTGLGAFALNSTTGNTYTGGTSLSSSATNSSVFYVNNTSGSGTGTGAVYMTTPTSTTVYSTLAGNFTISGASTIGGRISPGNGTGLTAAAGGIGSIGTANFGGALTLSSGTYSSLYLEIAAGGSNPSNDVINVAGLFTLNGVINLATTNGYTIQAGDTFDLINYGTVTRGTYSFSTTNLSTASNVSLTASFVTLSNGTGELLLTATAVPEPATVLGGLLCVGAFGWHLRRRRAPRRQAGTSCGPLQKS